MLKIARGSGPPTPAGTETERVHVTRRAVAHAVPGASISLLQTHSLPALVQREIERMILDGTLSPGTKLNEAALAEQLGVSRGPVREAFRALEETGLVRL
jgi:DNA-binding GntR family transcriptional regulator